MRRTTPVFKVVVNHEEQYSIWHADREMPVGWKPVGLEGFDHTIDEEPERRRWSYEGDPATDQDRRFLIGGALFRDAGKADTLYGGHPFGLDEAIDAKAALRSYTL